MNNQAEETIRVLFVDDEENVLKSLRRLFLDEVIEILTASSGKEGLELLKGNEVSVIVSDQRMPEMTGVEFLEKATRISPNSVKILLTGYADIDAVVSAINKGGVYRYITKPWNDNDLMITVLNAGERFRLVKENRRLTELTKKQNEELKKWSEELETYVTQQTIDLTNQNKELKKLAGKFKKNFREFISAFYNILELRNKIIYTHSNNVAALVSNIVFRMGLPETDAETIVTAAQFHDIGKLGLPDVQLIKHTDEFSPGEIKEYINHPVLGQASLDCVEELRAVGILVRHHHEWYNGDGFPDKLRHEKIPLGARIIAMADKFDRLTGINRGLQDIENALKKIKTLLGSQLDPDMYKFLTAAVQEIILPSAHEAGQVEVEVQADDLVPGLVLSRDIRSGTGLLLVKIGTVMNEKNMETLKRGYHMDPSKSGIFVWNKRNMQ